ncbi:MAG: LysR family transcriptional regulator [Alphaproteobacteria bacterium]|nr:LysR family transcriptional regulator [Alphaproteobacteria bacterium]
MDRLSQTETFVAVAEAESFTIAAERLGLSRAVVSKHVQALEDRLERLQFSFDHIRRRRSSFHIRLA